MTIWLEGRAAALGVTLIAVSGTTGIVRPGATDEGGGGMTEMAIQRGRNVVVILASRGNPVAGRAIINDAGMIKHRSDEGTGIMTDATILVCCYMVA
jgi:hypothetical protein